MIFSYQAVYTANLALSFSALEKSDTLNHFVNWASHGKINRHVLAQRMLHQAVELGAAYAVNNQCLGERSATLVPLLRGAIIDNDMARMRASVADLASHALSAYVATDGDGLSGAARRLLNESVRRSSADIAETLAGDHAAEKVVATLVRKHGWKPLDTFLQGTLAGYPLQNLITTEIKSLLQRAIVDRPDYDMRGNPEFELAVDVAASFMTGEGNYCRPLRDYVQARLATTHESMVSTVGQGLSGLQRTLGIEPRTEAAVAAFPSAPNDLAPALVVRALTTPRDIAQSLVHLRVLTDLASDDSVERAATRRIRSQLARMAPHRRAPLQEALDLFSGKQLAPLGSRSSINVGMTLGGKLARAQAASHLILTLPETGVEQTLASLRQAPTSTVALGGYQIGKAFARHIQSIDLTLPAGAFGYVDASVEASKALWQGAWSILGYTNDLDMQAASRLKQLYNACGQNEAVMREVTRYLDPALAEAAVGAPMLRALTDPDAGILKSSDQTIVLDLSRPPVIRFNVSPVDPFVHVGISVQYHVKAYGTDQAMHVPRGNDDSSVGAYASIHITPGPQADSTTTQFHHMGKLASIFNHVTFDDASGALQ